MNSFFKNKIDITILVTSYMQRETTLDTVNYYSEICNEVILVDEQQPYLSLTDIDLLKNRGITYISYNAKDNANTSPLEKRLIAATKAKNNYVVHSNHDERYTYYGLLACVSELENDKKLTFCAGQVIAIRKDESRIYYTRQYKNLSNYENINDVEQRLYYHAETYAPLAHYSVWRKESYINVTEKTISIHDLMPSKTIMEEVIFELAADLAGNSKATSELYWIRNRINPPMHGYYEKGEHVFKIIENKLLTLLNNIDNIQMAFIMNSFRNNFPFVKPSFIGKNIILIKRMMRKMIKKKITSNIDTLLDNNNIKYEKNDLSNALKSFK